MKKLIIGFVVLLAGAFLIKNVLATVNGNWGEWKDTSSCSTDQCGTNEGTKTQSRDYTSEVCDKGCPTVSFSASHQICPTNDSAYTSDHWWLDCKKKIGNHWKYSDKVTETFGPIDVVYGEKSEDPNHCHRPTGSSLNVPSWAMDDFNKLNLELDKINVNCRQEVTNTETQTVSCDNAPVVQCPVVCREDQVKVEDQCVCPEGKVEDDGKCIVENTPTPTPTETPTVTPTPTEGPSITPTPTEEPKKEEVTETHTGLSSPTHFVCPDKDVVKVVANPQVKREGESATVSFFLTEGDKASIFYGEVGQPHWQYGVADIKPTAGNYVNFTIHGLNPDLGYDFGIEQMKGCAGGPITSVIIDGPTVQWFGFSYLEF